MNSLGFKKACSSALCVLLSGTILAMPAYAISSDLEDINGDGIINVFDLVLAKRESVTASNPLELEVSGGQVKPGENIEIQLQLSNNIGFTSFSFLLEYDTALTPVAIDNTLQYTMGEILDPTELTIMPSGVKGSMLLMTNHAELHTENGLLLSMQFAVSEHAEVGKNYTISLRDATFTDSNYEIISSILLGKGSVSVLAGDGSDNSNIRKPSHWGIDVSRWQGDIDWEAVKADGVQFAMLRAGYGREITQEDPSFAQNYANATAAGIPVGAYWYSYADSPEDAVREANTCLSVLGDRTFTYPIAFDIEEPFQWELTPEEFSAIIEAFCTTMEEAGYYVMIYTSSWPLNHLLTPEIEAKYDVWVAQYSKPQPDYQGDYGIWQYSCAGKVNGIAGDVDLNYGYVDYQSLITDRGFNGFTMP